ncbi:MAG: hypothetical protein KAJ03_12055 [Gammaproteobacteria bacterium]|nr:hypothetical protein [Gammaproteobacteria bacterium]
MATAWQTDAFQNDAFQIEVVVPIRPTGGASPFFRQIEPQIVEVSDEDIIEVQVVRHLSHVDSIGVDTVTRLVDYAGVDVNAVRSIADVYYIEVGTYAIVNDSCEHLYDIVDTLLSEGHIEIKTLDSVLVKLKKANLAFDDDLLLIALKKRMVR